MIYVVKSIRRKGVLGTVPSCCETCAMRRPYTVAACDRCLAPCAGSRQEKTRGEAPKDAALARALELGWTQQHVYHPRDGRSKARVVVELVCPACRDDREEAGG